jgi:hypothetical protein
MTRRRGVVKSFASNADVPRRSHLPTVVLCVVLASLSVWQVLNFTGFCYSAGKYLSDPQLLEAAISREIADEYVGVHERWHTLLAIDQLRGLKLVRGDHPLLASQGDDGGYEMLSTGAMGFVDNDDLRVCALPPLPPVRLAA